MDVVPCQWLEDEKYRNECLLNAIKECDEPQESCLKCCVRVLHLFGKKSWFTKKIVSNVYPNFYVHCMVSVKIRSLNTCVLN